MYTWYDLVSRGADRFPAVKRAALALLRLPAVQASTPVNFLLNIKEKSQRRRGGRNGPSEVWIETTNLCNAACAICPHREMRRSKGVMDYPLYTKIIDDCSTLRSVRRIQMNLTGEPLLDKDIVRRIRYAKQKCAATTALFTNGSLLGRDTADALLESGLDQLNVSIDTFRREEYEVFRKNLNYENVIENTRYALETCARNHGAAPAVRICVTAPQQEKHRILRDFSQTPLSPYRKSLHIVPDELVHDWAGQTTLPTPDRKRPATSIRHRPCMRLWSTLAVLWDGTVALCCLDYEGRVLLGDLRQQTVRDVWRSDVLLRLRSLHLAGDFDLIPLCKSCSLRLPRWLVTK